MTTKLGRLALSKRSTAFDEYKGQVISLGAALGIMATSLGKTAKDMESEKVRFYVLFRFSKLWLDEKFDILDENGELIIQEIFTRPKWYLQGYQMYKVRIHE